MLAPLETYTLTEHFGDDPGVYEKFHVPGHTGLDFAAPQGTAVFSIAYGTVEWEGVDPEGYGNYIRIWHPELKVFSFYAHLSEIFAEKGETVEEGSIIAAVGSTGNSTGPHCHFEIRLAIDEDHYADAMDGYPRGRVNPETFYKDHGIML